MKAILIGKFFVYFYLEEAFIGELQKRKRDPSR